MHRTGIKSDAFPVPPALQRAWGRGIFAGVPGWAITIVLLALLILVPIAALLSSAFSVPTAALAYLWQHRIAASVGTTILLCVCVSAGALLLGSTTAWLLTRYRLRGERLLTVLLILPLAIPSYIHAYSIGGFITAQPFLMAWYVLTFSLTPYAFIISRFAFRKESRVLFDAAQVQGVRYPYVRLALPMARPALIGALTLISMEVLNEYGTFVYLGIETLTTSVFKLWFGYYDIRGAAQLASYILIGIICVSFVERRSRLGINYAQSYAELEIHTRGKIGRVASPFAYAYCALPILGGVGLPAALLVYWSLRSGRHLFVETQLWVAAGHTVAVAAAAAVLCVAVALLLAYGKRLVNRRVVTWLVGISAYGYTVPGAIIAIGILRVAGNWIAVASLAFLLFAYVVRYVAVCYYPFEGALTQQCACTDEVAQSLEPSCWRRIWRIILPQLRTPIASVAILIVFDIIKDLPLTIILRPIGLETLALQSFYYASEEQFGLAAPFAIVMFVIGIAIVLLTQWGKWNEKKP